MQVFVVLCAGQYTAEINGKAETADRCAVVGIYSTHAQAEQVQRAWHPGEGWGVSDVWVDTAVVDAPAIDGL